MSTVDNNEQVQEETTTDKKKISLKDAIKQKLASKKQEQPKGKATANSQETKKLSNQNSKKNTLQRRKIGG